ncbi:pseudouridylate synthase 1 homolog isoform X1 [Schistocerca cancellata]|uniref:pseudouridylate synthase 1 homolog isoform X1 n=2 Tax=Schistocerca cancellata TaxID=274614 RepID=UPI00211997B3|nr:pseudouridylate synthase 1 homolog isoform X1 [Schistocerca cancellata]
MLRMIYASHKYYSVFSSLFLGNRSGIWNQFLKMSDHIAADTEKTEALETRKRALDEDDPQPNVKRHLTEKERVKRKKVAMLVSYSGQGYLGMQRNPGAKTIEEDLLTAMLRAGFIPEEAFTSPQQIQFQRAARTDKGVSAARQILSLKLPEGANTSDINKHLPDQIRVFAIKRTTKGFNSKSACDARTYSYTLPTFAFMPAGEEVSENFRVSSTIINNVNSVLKMFEGTHNFHNFTSRKKPLDPSAHRYIMNFVCGEPFTSENMEFCTIKIKGQSFMLHQIRKMIGLAVAVSRGHTTIETINKSWKPDRIDIPMAPGVGLVLEEVHYDRYNKRYGNDGLHEPLTWDDVEKELITFREKYIYSAIVNTEISEKCFLNWLLTLPYHSYDIRNQNAELDNSSPINEVYNKNEKVDESTLKTSNSAFVADSENAGVIAPSLKNSSNVPNCIVEEKS